MEFWATIDKDSAPSCPPGIRVMAPISAWWRHDVELKRSVTLPHQDLEVAVDVGSYTFAQRFEWFPYGITAESIVSWCERLQPQPRLVVLPDWPCEDLDARRVADAQARSLATQIEMVQRFSDVPWTWVPVVQGLRLLEYLRMAIGMADFVHALQDFYQSRDGVENAFRLGIGSICRRGQVSEISAITRTIAQLLPGIRQHWFGVKLDVLRLAQAPLPDEAFSLDTGAWNRRFGSDIPAFNEGMRRTGLTQRQYAWQYCYPPYAAAVARFTIRDTRQLSLAL